MAETVRLYPNSYALVIGIDRYTAGWPRPSNAVKDARLVAAVLEARGFAVTLEENLDSSALKQAFERFFVLKGQDPKARLFVWFTGHGHAEHGEGYLVPVDAPGPDAGPGFRLKALSMRRFGEFVRQARAKHAYAVFDACFAGTIFDTARGRPPAAITRATTLPVRQFLTSGDAAQQVSDDGRFRKLFVRALEGGERATAGACLTRCVFYVGNDSGLMHLAAASGIPTLGLFGPSQADRYAPAGRWTAYVRTRESVEELVGAPGFVYQNTETHMDGLSIAAAAAAAEVLWRRCQGAAA